MSSQAISKKTITCFLCGGVHIHPGPRFGNHLLHEHGVVFNHEYIVQVSLYKDNHSSLPPISTSSSKPEHSQSSQTDLLGHTTCSRCAKPVNEFLTSTPVRKNVFHNPKLSTQPSMNMPSPSSFFSTPSNHSMIMMHSRSMQDQSTQEAPPAGKASDLPARSGFLCKCALCDYVNVDDTAFWGHITKKHRLNWKKYKEEYGSGQTATGSGKFTCQICQVSMKHMPGSVDKHLKARHGLSWSQYLDWFKKEMLGREQENESVVKSEVAEASGDQTMEESLPLQPSEQTIKKSRPLNIRDKTNKFCSYCEVTFNTRILFLKHCQDVHKLRFKNKSGGPVVLNQSSSCVEDAKETSDQHQDSSQSRSITSNNPSMMNSLNRGSSIFSLTPSISSTQQASSTLDMVVSTSTIKKKPGEGAFPCRHCKKMYSSFSNMERHARLSCTMRDVSGSAGQQVIPVMDRPVVGTVDGSGFKCTKCGRVYSKLGNLNRHYISTCFTPPSQ